MTTSSDESGVYVPGRLLRSGAPHAQLAAMHVPQRLLAQSVTLPDAHRDRGLHLVAGSGSGKSLTLGHTAYFDFLRGVPQVLFDPAGQMIDAFLLKIAQFSKPIRRELWSKIVYVDMSGRSGSPVAWPLLFGLPGDSLRDVADRFLETCLAIDPHLASASMQGFNALSHVGAPTGMVLSSLGLQLDSAIDLLNNPEHWYDRLAEAEGRDPQASTAVDFFRHEYLPRSLGGRMELTNSYRAKLEPIVQDQGMRAMFCEFPAGVNLEQVVRARQTVLLDFRGETNPRKRLLKTRWVFDSMLAYIRHRGPGKHRPLAIHFDEITELTNQASLGVDLFARDLDYLFNVLQRNYSLWITAAHQQMWQLSERSQETLLSLGTQMVGVLSDFESASAIARRYSSLDPYRVKRWENVWASDSLSGHFIIEKRPVDFPMDEQVFLAARSFMALEPFHFYLKPRNGTRLRHVSVGSYMGDPWPTDHPEVLERIREKLAQRSQDPVASRPREIVHQLPALHPPSDTLEASDGDQQQTGEQHPDLQEVFRERISRE
jgi:hypothetical protein